LFAVCGGVVGSRSIVVRVCRLSSGLLVSSGLLALRVVLQDSFVSATFCLFSLCPDLDAFAHVRSFQRRLFSLKTFEDIPFNRKP
jgi:hypothetical protein